MHGRSIETVLLTSFLVQGRTSSLGTAMHTVLADFDDGNDGEDEDDDVEVDDEDGEEEDGDGEDDDEEGERKTKKAWMGCLSYL
eukprot:COSAG02_NODE_1300_length_13379_cov_18.739121_6_plen_84_part_00